MPVITVSSLKGGVGKTTISLHLAHGLARAGYQVLLLDCDLSCHVSRFLGMDFQAEEQPVGVECLLRPLEELGVKHSEDGFSFSGIPQSLLHTEIRPNLDLIAGSPNLRNSLHPSNTTEMEYLLTRSVKFFSQCYSFVVIDTGPELNLLTKNALRAADLILIPTDGSMMSIDSFSDLIHFDVDIPSNASRCVLRNMVSRAASRTTALSDAAVKDRIQSLSKILGERTRYQTHAYVGLLETTIRRAEALHQLSFMKRTAFDSSAFNAIASNFSELVQEILYLSMLKTEEKADQSLSTRLRA